MTELHNVQLAVMTMMADNNITTIPNPVTIATNDMSTFPDTTTAASAKGLAEGDKAGYLLWGHDKNPDGRTWPTINYVSADVTTWTYLVESDGTVTQDPKGQSDSSAPETLTLR